MKDTDLWFGDIGFSVLLETMAFISCVLMVQCRASSEQLPLKHSPTLISTLRQSSCSHSKLAESALIWLLRVVYFLWIRWEVIYANEHSYLTLYPVRVLLQ